MAVVADVSIADLGEGSIGGGDHGVSVTISSNALCAYLDADLADVTTAAARP